MHPNFVVYGEAYLRKGPLTSRGHLTLFHEEELPVKACSVKTLCPQFVNSFFCKGISPQECPARMTPHSCLSQHELKEVSVDISPQNYIKIYLPAEGKCSMVP